MELLSCLPGDGLTKEPMIPDDILPLSHLRGWSCSSLAVFLGTGSADRDLWCVSLVPRMNLDGALKTLNKVLTMSLGDWGDEERL